MLETDAGRIGGPIFLVGTMGSGTTLLRLMLDSHENLAIAQETTFMRALLAHKWIPFWKFGGEWYGRIGWTEKELDAELAAFYGRLFGRFAEQRGASRWGDKSPHHIWHMAEAAAVFPDAVFVATVRHPGAAAWSMHNRFGFGWRESVDIWQRHNRELVHHAATLGDRVALCRYEDLVLDPETTLRELLQWLGEPWSPSVLEHHRVQNAAEAPRAVEGGTRTDEPVDGSRRATWDGRLNDPQRAVLDALAAPLAGFFGYSLTDPHALAPVAELGGRHQRVLLGTELPARRALYSDRINWQKRPKRSMENSLLKPQALAALRAKAAAAAAGRPAVTAPGSRMGRLGAALPAPFERVARGAVRRVRAVGAAPTAPTKR